MSLLRLHTESTSQPADVTDDSCTLKYIEIVPLTTDAEDRCTAVSDREDWSSDDYEQGLLPVVKQEPDVDVCFRCTGFLNTSLHIYCGVD